MKEFKVPKNPYDVHYDTSDMIALIDADKFKHIITHRQYKSLQDTGERLDIKEQVEQEINYLVNSFKCKSMVFFFSGKNQNTFRSYAAIDRIYKGNRNDKEDKYMYEGKFDDLKLIITTFKELHPFIFYEDIEADDLISMLSNDKTFVVSDDKDLMQIKGLHYDLKTDSFIMIDDSQSIERLSIQMLIGDATDNVISIDGVGIKTAEKILHEVEPKYKLFKVLKEYISRYGIIEGFDRFTESWYLLKLRINREGFFKEKYKDAFMLIDTLITLKTK